MDLLPENKEAGQTIFIMVAAYRDPELVPTIQDALARARFAENLRFGICRQFHPDDHFDNLDVYKEDHRFRILDVPYEESKGVCWARNLTQQLYRDETYALQIDSHMRFIEDWDVRLIDMLELLHMQGYAKPLLTGYVPAYNPKKEFVPKEDVPPYKMEVDYYTKARIPMFKAEFIPDWQQLAYPVPAKFISGGFYFTSGLFCREVEYDPGIYFTGEEISLSARAYTHGYDLFHPHRTLIWHYYVREENKKHWNDDSSWHQKDKISFERVRTLLGMEEPGEETELSPYGLGPQRSLEDYEKYCGIIFREIEISPPVS